MDKEKHIAHINEEITRLKKKLGESDRYDKETDGYAPESKTDSTRRVADGLQDVRDAIKKFEDELATLT